LRDPAERRPDERALALVAHPRVEVVGDEREREARALGDLRLADELVRRMVFGREGEAELHAAQVPGRDSCKRCVTRPRCGSTTYPGSRADCLPALNTAQRRHSSPAQTSAPPTARAARLCFPRRASRVAPAIARPFAAHENLPAAPCR